MIIEKLVKRELTEGEIDSIKKFRFYSDGISFACLGERIMVMIDIEDQKDPEKLKDAAKKIMEKTLNTHCDFHPIPLKDGRLLILLTDGVLSFTKDPIDEKEENMGIYLYLRNECLAACEKGEILAVVYEE